MESQLALWEKSELSRCEAVIDAGMKTFMDVGSALLDIREKKLYRQDFDTFEDYCREKWNIQRAYAYRLINAVETISYLSPIGDILPETETQARPLTRLEPTQQREAWAQAVETAPNGKITAAHVQSVVTQILERPALTELNKPHVSFNSGNNEWYTPPEYAEAARNVLGEIDLDPASSEIANRTVKARDFYSVERDGLKEVWRGRVWMNPPYAAGLIDKFTEKLALHYSNGDVSEAIVLVNNATETGWFQSILVHASAVCFVKKRIRYIDADGNQASSPLQGQAILYLGKNPDSFTSNFFGFGKVLYGN